MRIGFVGLGVMGAPMVTHLARAGHALTLNSLGIALQLARETATPMPMAGLGQQLWRMADQAAGPGASVSELVRWVEGLTGTELRAVGTPP